MPSSSVKNFVALINNSGDNASMTSKIRFNNVAVSALLLLLTSAIVCAQTPKVKIETVHLEDWVRPNSLWGNTSYENGQLFMGSKEKTYYYVIVATEEYVTVGATARVTLKNVDASDTSLGYGLIFHSDTTPLIKGYAFLINTMSQQYSVVRHVPDDELTLIPWTPSSAIKTLTEDNTLEIRDVGERTELLINGKLVNSVTNEFASKDGVVGLYSGDQIKIAFSQLILSRTQPAGNSKKPSP